MNLRCSQGPQGPQGTQGIGNGARPFVACFESSTFELPGGGKELVHRSDLVVTVL